MNKRNLISLVATILMPMFLFGQVVTEEKVETSIGGVVSDESDSPIVGANVIVVGTDLGSAADADGYYSIDLGVGSYTLIASAIGYESQSSEVSIKEGDANIANFVLSISAVEMTALEVLASRAGEKTPVAHSTVSKEEMEFRLGSQDLPMALNLTPSVYATQQGGGAGDARINIRGFNQRNIAVMINGVPQNDMENGWVYWSNWDGVGDTAASIQVQRGLSAVNLLIMTVYPLKSIGGSIIIGVIVLSLTAFIFILLFGGFKSILLVKIEKSLVLKMGLLRKILLFLKNFLDGATTI